MKDIFAAAGIFPVNILKILFSRRLFM